MIQTPREKSKGHQNGLKGMTRLYVITKKSVLNKKDIDGFKVKTQSHPLAWQ